MEQRKVQVTGGSTYTVSLPKSWANQNDIEAGSEIAFFPDKDSLLLSTPTQDEKTEGSLDISDLEGESLKRAVMTMYVSGFDILNLEADRISAYQRRVIREAAQSLVGLEVIEETSTRVVIQDLLDSSELSIHNAVRRMRLIALSMLEDAMTSLSEHDDDLAQDVIGRDDEVDRLWYMVSRIFRSTLRSPKAARELGMSREACFDYHTCARQLERIADHAAKIAELSLEIDNIPNDVLDGLLDLYQEADDTINISMDAFFEDDSAEATELGNEGREINERIDEYARKIDEQLREETVETSDAQHIGLIVDSLSRSADYGGNIAETALQNAAPKPDI